MVETKAISKDVKKDTVDIVLSKVQAFQRNGELKFPENYVPENALKSAWLLLQEAVDRDHKPALEVCTRESIANSLLSMVIQGLNPDKKQCYFICYGKKLQMQRSYFGAMHIAKSVDDTIIDIFAEVVYEGDIFEYSLSGGKKVVTLHTQKIENINKAKIIAAYACIVRESSATYTIMPMAEILQSWKQSKTNPVDESGKINPGSTHGKFTADMAMRTVINKACKPIINSSDDSNIVAAYAKKNDIETAEAEAQEEIGENANTIEIEQIKYDAKPEPEKNVEQPVEMPDFVKVLTEYKRLYPVELHGLLKGNKLEEVPFEDLSLEEADLLIEAMDKWLKSKVKK